MTRKHPHTLDLFCSEYPVECACVRAQCPVRRCAKRVKKCSSQDGGGDHNGEEQRTPAKAVEASGKQSQPPIKRPVHERLKVEIPANDCATQRPVVS